MHMCLNSTIVIKFQITYPGYIYISCRDWGQ